MSKAKRRWHTDFCGLLPYDHQGNLTSGWANLHKNGLKGGHRCSVVYLLSIPSLGLFHLGDRFRGFCRNEDSFQLQTEESP